jgi:PKD repeat protein
MARALRAFTLLAAIAAVTACNVKDTKVPPLSGPSELGLSLTVQASPDILVQDGSSSSQVIVLARDPNGQPVRNVTCRIDITVDGQAVDFGRLSNQTITTGSDGRAVVTYTAPPSSFAASAGNTVVLAITPYGTDYNAAMSRTVSIRLVPAVIVEPPKGAWFNVTPMVPHVGEQCLLDGTASTSPSGKPIVSYDWTFGDGYSKRTTVAYANHDWEAPGTYAVTLKITDEDGATWTKMVIITVVAAEK